jgi:hypothetical protein
VSRLEKARVHPGNTAAGRPAWRLDLERPSDGRALSIVAPCAANVALVPIPERLFCVMVLGGDLVAVTARTAILPDGSTSRSPDVTTVPSPCWQPLPLLLPLRIGMAVLVTFHPRLKEKLIDDKNGTIRVPAMEC